MLKVVASQDLWIWHAFSCVEGTYNDINVLNQSNVFNDILQGQTSTMQYKVNAIQHNMGYNLANGIYPNWAFGQLQSRFTIVCGPTCA